MQQQDSLFNSSDQILQVHRVDQTLLPAQVDSFVGCSLHCALHPPATRFKKGEDRRKKKREVLHLCLLRCYTHTHTRPEPGQPRKARGRKKRTHEGQTAKNSAGGEVNRRTSGTNLHGETDLIKTAHTPKPHDTLRRGTRGN